MRIRKAAVGAGAGGTFLCAVQAKNVGRRARTSLEIRRLPRRQEEALTRHELRHWHCRSNSRNFAAHGVSARPGVVA
jgi:hypothetical protein